MCKTMYSILVFLMMLLGLEGCQSLGSENNQQSAPIAANELFHNELQDINVMRGPLLDGLSGQEIDQIMDFGDRENMIVAIIKAPLHQTITWINYRRHVQYQVTPILVNWAQQGFYCREYEVTVASSNNNLKRAQGRLCRINKNTWQAIPVVVDSQFSTAWNQVRVMQ